MKTFGDFTVRPDGSAPGAGVHVPLHRRLSVPTCVGLLLLAAAVLKLHQVIAEPYFLAGAGYLARGTSHRARGGGS